MLENLNSDNTALLVVDKQIAYIADGQTITTILNPHVNPFKDVLPDIDRFISFCRTKNIEIIWTKMIEDLKHSPLNIRTKMKISGTPTISDPNSESFRIDGLGPARNEKVIIKKYYDAFAQTDLDSYLKSAGIVNIVLVGGYASRCILGTAYGANGNDYNVIIPADLVSNPELLTHEIPVALEVTNSILGYVTSEKELRAVL